MRRSEREVHDHRRMLDILNRCDCLRLAIADEDAPYVVPVNFGWEESDGGLRLYFHSAREGHKIRLLAQQPRVGFELDCSHQFVAGEPACRSTFLYASIIGVGVVHFATTKEEKRHGLQRLMAHYAPGHDSEFPESTLARVCVGCVRVERISCKEHL